MHGIVKNKNNDLKFKKNITVSVEKIFEYIVLIINTD